MITIAACGRADIVADVTFTDGHFETYHIGNRQPHGFVLVLAHDNIRATKAHVENCIEPGREDLDPYTHIRFSTADRLIGTMLCVVGDKVEAFTANGDAWEWKR